MSWYHQINTAYCDDRNSPVQQCGCVFVQKAKRALQIQQMRETKITSGGTYRLHLLLQEQTHQGDPQHDGDALVVPYYPVQACPCSVR